MPDYHRPPGPGVEMVGLTEIARMAGVTDTTAGRYTRDVLFPPGQKLARGTVWPKPAVAWYLREIRQAGAGRPRNDSEIARLRLLISSCQPCRAGTHAACLGREATPCACQDDAHKRLTGQRPTLEELATLEELVTISGTSPPGDG